MFSLLALNGKIIKHTSKERFNLTRNKLASAAAVFFEVAAESAEELMAQLKTWEPLGLDMNALKQRVYQERGTDGIYHLALDCTSIANFILSDSSNTVDLDDPFSSDLGKLHTPQEVISLKRSGQICMACSTRDNFEEVFAYRAQDLIDAFKEAEKCRALLKGKPKTVKDVIKRLENGWVISGIEAELHHKVSKDLRQTQLGAALTSIAETKAAIWAQVIEFTQSPKADRLLRVELAKELLPLEVMKVQKENVGELTGLNKAIFLSHQKTIETLADHSSFVLLDSHRIGLNIHSKPMTNTKSPGANTPQSRRSTWLLALIAGVWGGEEVRLVTLPYVAYEYFLRKTGKDTYHIWVDELVPKRTIDCIKVLYFGTSNTSSLTLKEAYEAALALD